MQAELTGQIERITYNDLDTGFTIAKLKVRGRPDLVTVVGNLMSPAPGEVLELKGAWTTHPKYGPQFKILEHQTSVPATVNGIRKYLGSGLIKGLGPVMADRIVKQFGSKTLDVIDENVERLAEVEGIGKKRIDMIRDAWDAQKEIRDVMIFLQDQGVSSGYAAKIFKRYGKRAIALVRDNPYRLATDIFGIGFVTADKIAEKIGFPADSPRRIEAGILYVLNQLSDEGHVYYPYEELIEKSCEILDVPTEPVQQAIGSLTLGQQIFVEDLNESLDSFRLNHKAVYLSQYHVCETGIARRLKALCMAAKSYRPIESQRALDWVQAQLSIRLAQNQQLAVRHAVDQKVTVITGGPGTGKTTIVGAILRILSGAGATMLLAAPTGRAAKRLGETTGRPAKTIHRLLEFSPAKGGFQRNEKRPLKCDLLVIDEASMIDTILMYQLLKALPDEATLILVGDIHQLPSVGAGNVLGDVIASGTVKVVELNEIFRQARESHIVVNAHRINQGKSLELESPGAGDNGLTDFYFIQQEDPEKVLDIILELSGERIPKRFGLDPVDDIQVLAPMHRGVIGAGNLNNRLQSALNPGFDGVVRSERSFRVNDKVMQIRNNYDKDVYNGDIGRIIRIEPDSRRAVILFEGREVSYDFGELDEIVLAYAISVHKSQGSEYPAVIIPVMTQHFLLLQRNLIYTAITRGKKLVVLVGTRKALAIGIKNDKTQRRYTFLRQRLRE